MRNARRRGVQQRGYENRASSWSNRVHTISAFVVLPRFFFRARRPTRKNAQLA